MNSEFRAKASMRRRCGLRWEVLETRDLLSTVADAASASGSRHHAHRDAAALVQIPVTPPTDAGGGQPSAHELARETFIGKISTNYVVGKGRFSDQALSLSLEGAGFSSMAYHTNLQMILFTPADPATGTVTGQAALSGRNIATSGTQLGLDLTGDPSSEVNGLPTQFTWQVNGTSGGIYSNATGQGTLTISYVPGGPVPNRGLSAGKAYVTIQGYVDVVGVYNNLATPGNRP